MNKITDYIKPFSHILFWSIVFVIPLYIISRNSYIDYGPYINFLIRTSILIVLFYINYLYLIDKFLFNRQFIAFFAINIILVASLIGIQTLLNDFVVPHPPMHPRPDGSQGRPPMMLRMFWDYMLIILIIGMSVAMKATIRWHRDSVNYEKIKSVQLEADLRNLRSQLNPHFLFNTLNNIYSLIAIDQNKAQESVHRLSGLLRYILYDNDVQFVPIDKELEFTQNYINLMSLRMGKNVKLDVAINNKESNDLIASLMFITLIENAFKHGITSKEDCFIDIRIFVESSKGVLCTVENSLPSETTKLETKNSGIGLANLTKRLELLYPSKHQFIVEKRDNSFYTLLRIAFDGNENNKSNEIEMCNNR